MDSAQDDAWDTIAAQADARARADAYHYDHVPGCYAATDLFGGLDDDYASVDIIEDDYYEYAMGEASADLVAEVSDLAAGIVRPRLCRESLAATQTRRLVAQRFRDVALARIERRRRRDRSAHAIGLGYERQAAMIDSGPSPHGRLVAAQPILRHGPPAPAGRALAPRSETVRPLLAA